MPLTYHPPQRSPCGPFLIVDVGACARNQRSVGVALTSRTGTRVRRACRCNVALRAVQLRALELWRRDTLLVKDEEDRALSCRRDDLDLLPSFTTPM